ncbi:hypothetical protein RRG08_058578 [Elysia crispata]|uniref:Uncharacterized protein n=1 Tax=Elysia crispata TaxID=231223 RepID=A0AAE0ZKA9_9GAST|nr:hypothetical protein RRG08_058578 [Elysia crispata]
MYSSGYSRYSEPLRILESRRRSEQHHVGDFVLYSPSDIAHKMNSARRCKFVLSSSQPDGGFSTRRRWR